MTHRLIIDGTLPGLNEYIKAERTNRHIAAKLKRDTEDCIVYCIRGQLRGVKFRAPVRLHYTWIEPNRKRDKSNVAFAKKFIEDALIKAGTLVNDGWTEIDGFTDAFAVDRRYPRVVVEIEQLMEVSQ